MEEHEYYAEYGRRLQDISTSLRSHLGNMALEPAHLLSAATLFAGTPAWGAPLPCAWPRSCARERT